MPKKQFRQTWYVEGEAVTVKLWKNEDPCPHITVFYRKVRNPLRISIMSCELLTPPKPKEIPQWIVNGLKEKVRKKRKRLMKVWEGRTGYLAREKVK